MSLAQGARARRNVPRAEINEYDFPAKCAIVQGTGVEPNGAIQAGHRPFVFAGAHDEGCEHRGRNYAQNNNRNSNMLMLHHAVTGLPSRLRRDRRLMRVAAAEPLSCRWLHDSSRCLQAREDPERAARLDPLHWLTLHDSSRSTSAICRPGAHSAGRASTEDRRFSRHFVLLDDFRLSLALEVQCTCQS